MPPPGQPGPQDTRHPKSHSFLTTKGAIKTGSIRSYSPKGAGLPRETQTPTGTQTLACGCGHLPPSPEPARLQAAQAPSWAAKRVD